MQPNSTKTLISFQCFTGTSLINNSNNNSKAGEMLWQGYLGCGQSQQPLCHALPLQFLPHPAAGPDPTAGAALAVGMSNSRPHTDSRVRLQCVTGEQLSHPESKITMQAFFEKIVLGKSAIKESIFCISLSWTDGKSSSDDVAPY